MGHAITLELPEDAYRQAERLAAAAHADLHAVLVDALERGLPCDPESAALDEMAQLTDDELSARSRGSIDRRKLATFDRLRHAQQERDLTPAEEVELAALREAYQLAQLDMARAAAVLAMRRQLHGQDPR